MLNVTLIERTLSLASNPCSDDVIVILPPVNTGKLQKENGGQCRHSVISKVL